MKSGSSYENTIIEKGMETIPKSSTLRRVFMETLLSQNLCGNQTLMYSHVPIRIFSSESAFITVNHHKSKVHIKVCFLVS